MTTKWLQGRLDDFVGFFLWTCGFVMLIQLWNTFFFFCMLREKYVIQVMPCFHRGNGRHAVAVLSSCHKEQGEEVRAPPTDEYISPQPYVFLLVMYKSPL